MAFGIDDALFIAAGGISLADTLATVIRNYGGKIDDIDIETLTEQVRVEALRRIKAADGALADFEKLLNDKDVDANMSVTEAIERTRIWNWSERRSLSSIVDDFNELHKRIYGAIDDVAALVQCKGRGLPRICSCGKFGEKAQVSRELFERAHYQGKRLIPLAPALPTCSGIKPSSPRQRQDVDRAGSNGISLQGKNSYTASRA